MDFPDDIIEDFKKIMMNGDDDHLQLILGRCSCCQCHYGISINCHTLDMKYNCIRVDKEPIVKCSYHCATDDCPLKKEKTIQMIRNKNAETFLFLFTTILFNRGHARLLSCGSVGENFYVLRALTNRLESGSFYLYVYRFGKNTLCDFRMADSPYERIRPYFIILIKKIYDFLEKLHINIVKIKRIFNKLTARRIFFSLSADIFGVYNSPVGNKSSFNDYLKTKYLK